MTNIVAVLIVRCTHTGVYADGRPNPGSVTIYDLDENWATVNRERSVPIPPGSTVDIPMSTKTFVSWHEGAICKFTMLGLIRTEIILQLRDKNNCGGPAGTGQALRPAVLNIERVGNVLRLVLPDNVIPTNLDSVGFMVGEPVEITGLTGAFRKLNGTYVITDAIPATGLAGAAAGSYLVEAPSVGPDLAAATLAGVNLCLAEGRVTAQFNSGGDVGGFGSNVIGYIGGQFFPNAGGGGGGEDLAATLVIGNSTGGTDILVSSGDSIVGVTDLVLNPGGGGGDNVIIDGLTWPSADGLAGQALVTNGAGVLSFAAPTPALHAPTHIHLGTDQIDGDRLDIDFVPTTYTRTIVAPFTTSLEELTSHLNGIDLALAAAGGAATAVVMWGNDSVASSTATRVLDPGFEARTAPLSSGTGFNEWRVPRAGTLRNLYVRHNNPGGTGATITYTVFVNGVATAITIGVASTAAGGADTVNSVAVVAGDRIRIEVTKAVVAGGGSIQPEVTLEVAA
jgi:hypothetical protein